MYTLPSQVPPFYIPTWKVITYPGVESNRYMVCNDGRVYDIKLNKYIMQQNNPSGYWICNLSTGDKFRVFLTHRLVAYEFSNINDIDISKKEVNHIDGNKSNCLINNLEWVDHSDNMKHSAETNLTSHSKRTNKLTEEQVHEICRLMQDTDMTNVEIIDELGLDIAPNTLSPIRNQKAWIDISSQYDIYSTKLMSPKLSDDEVHKICAELEKDEVRTYRDIAIRLGYDPTDNLIIKRISCIAQGITYKSISSMYNIQPYKYKSLIVDYNNSKGVNNNDNI